MVYSLYELVWFYLIYSFVGWCLEVCSAAAKRKKFVNRGFVTAPLCPIYGTGAVAFAIFLPELKDSLFFLFLGGAILASLVEFFTGVLLEKIFGRKWWDYSGQKFNFDGYICLRYSVIWGISAVLLVCFVNPFLQGIIRIIPHLPGVILVSVLIGLLALDAVGSSLAIWGLQKKLQRVSDITENLKSISGILENSITRYIQRRMEDSFPNLDEEELAKEKALKEEKQKVFAEGCGYYKLICLFFIGAFLGDIIETIFCLLTSGKLMSRSSVVYGPFSIVWGIGCMLLTAVLYRYKDKSDGYIFTAGTILGGAYEYICSVFTELVFGTVFWDYSDFMFNLGGRINLLYCFFWGIASVIWIKKVYPHLSGLIERLPVRFGKIMCNLLAVFMIFNMSVSSLALARYNVRNTQPSDIVQEGQQNRNNSGLSGLDDFLDRHFPDERMERIYPNAKIVQE
ncbi:putative ABC transporter permease [Murimonas intestini]|uniref:Membrane protein n=1 Tax=Murimonas intestini TaxID=1337051 RepID=A0AB73SY82_9FIRM|nr:putative ABC transporter permease [Murimonas intestini]MCR1842235.1 putative ABC transporter permease [Murimonas intestini]MCR1868317.1 putative ABC transporter permease [Murimonas intestini]MCR1885761.1 putative ABC transporter permease [Murimonas intestini]